MPGTLRIGVVETPPRVVFERTDDVEEALWNALGRNIAPDASRYTGGTLSVPLERFLATRNWLAGARDMYLTTSSDGGKNFSPAQKLGEGSWKLDACPMDGGSLVIGAGGEVASVWRRETTVYYARPGEREIPLGEGRSPMMSRQGSATYVVWEERSTIKLGWPGSAIVTNVGEGRHPQVLALPNGRVVVAWEKDGRVRMQSYDMSPHHTHEGM